MEIVMLVALVASIATNAYLVKKIGPVTVNVPAPIVTVTVEAPEPVALEPITMEVSQTDNKVLEALLAKLVERQEQPFIPVAPVPMPTYPAPTYPNYPIITSDSTNEVEIDGVKGKKFPAR